MSWLESHQSLAQHPKLLSAASKLGLSKSDMIGKLHLLWWWALDYAPEGDLSGYPHAVIAHAADWTGDPDEFIEALVTCSRPGHAGFLERPDAERLVIHDWWQYAGKLIEARKADAARKRAGKGSTPDVAAPSAGHPVDIRRISGGYPPEIRPASGCTNQPTVPTVPTAAATRARVREADTAPATSTAAARPVTSEPEPPPDTDTAPRNGHKPAILCADDPEAVSEDDAYQIELALNRCIREGFPRELVLAKITLLKAEVKRGQRRPIVNLAGLVLKTLRDDAVVRKTNPTIDPMADPLGGRKTISELQAEADARAGRHDPTPEEIHEGVLEMRRAYEARKNGAR